MACFRIYPLGALLITFLLLLTLRDVSACGRGSVYIVNNEYKQMLIAIGENVPENPNLITKIKEAFTSASEFLYQITRKRAYFKDITILVPKTWRDKPEYEPLGQESFDKSDIVVDVPDDRFQMGNVPFVIKTTPCGQLGHYMHLTPSYLLDTAVSELFGPVHKTLIHEWSHLRYGVYDEYPSETDGQHFYAAEHGDLEATRCSLALGGQMINKNTGQYGCYYEGGLPETDCRFVDNTGVSGRYGSLLYRQYLEHITEFCDNDPSNRLTFHNSIAPTQQNERCDGKSIWEVLREHGDFENNFNPPRNVTSTEPDFKVVRQKQKASVLVLDISGSMSNQGRIQKLGQACSNYISNIARDGELLGIVWFQTKADIKIQLTRVSNATRQTLRDKIPKSTGGGTSIGDGILKGLQVLKQAGITGGGNLIVVTDGAENRAPYIRDVRQRVIDAKVTIDSIAITNAADTKLDGLAIETGGYAFLYSVSDKSNALNEAFIAIGERNLDPYERKYTLISNAASLGGGNTLSGNFFVDATLSRDAEFNVDYSGNDVAVTLTAPSGVTYNETSSICSRDNTFGVYMFALPEPVEAGRWMYSITNKQNGQQKLAITLTAQATTRGQYPIIAQSFWGRRSVSASATRPDRQALYASVSQGYTAVLNADVIADVERPSGGSVRLILRDNGAGADITKNDGIYSSYFVDFNGNGRYSVTVTVNSLPTTVISPRRIIGKGAAFTQRNAEDMPDLPTGLFQRVTSAGSFNLENYNSNNRVYYPPEKISDFHLVSAKHEEQLVTLRWTAPGQQLDSGTASEYELRMSLNPSQIRSNFSYQNLVSDHLIVSGANLSYPEPAGTTQNVTIRVPTNGNVTYAFGIVAKNGRGQTGPVSNVVTASLRYFPSRSDNYGLILGIVGGCLAFIILTVILVYIVIRLKRGTSVSSKVRVTETLTVHHVQNGTERTISESKSYDNAGYTSATAAYTANAPAKVVSRP